MAQEIQVSLSLLQAQPSGEYAAIAVSIAALALAIWTAWIQRTHNKLSVRPLAEIQVRDLDGHILVKISNHGTGPLLVRNMRVVHGALEASRLIDVMPPDNNWTFFADDIDGRSIPPQGEIILLSREYNPRSRVAAARANKIRRILSEVAIRVTYTDIYNQALPVKERKLTFFARTL